ncbi:lasso peptide biosynthesis B2 protein [Nocardia fluminea]|uniref:lasso peptide biosynthesis B2 protein n=1 Tax=Nocardia fluminea TaxID=134984 RepID=UPI0033FF6C4E
MKFYAWSNGHVIEFDSDANRYSLVDPESSVQLVRGRPEISTMALRQVLRSPKELLPPIQNLADFLNASCIAARMRKSSIAEQLKVIEKRARRFNPTDIESTGPALTELAAVYQHLRSLRVRQPLCLEDSVAGYQFFRRHTSAVQLVIGVRYPPFRAHAWLEADGVLLNDRKETVETMSEIYRWPR